MRFTKPRGVGIVAVLIAVSCGDEASSPAPAAPDAAMDATAIENDADAGTDETESSTPTAPAEASIDSAFHDVAPDAATDQPADVPSADASLDSIPAESSDRDVASVEASGNVDGAEGGPIPAIACDGPGSRFVTDIVSSHFGEGQDFGRAQFPANVFGPPKGKGCCLAGSLDVVSLGDGGTVTVAFAGNAIIDGPGPDFIVFENPFDIASDPTRPYAEPGTVEVSQNGVDWVAFPCTATSYPYGTCAGWHPVFANPDENAIDPTDPAVAGGDPFDLSDVGLSWARLVRITDRPGDALVFDLDAVAIVHPMCP